MWQRSANKIIFYSPLLAFSLSSVFLLFFLIVCLLPTPLYASTAFCDPISNVSNCANTTTSTSSSSPLPSSNTETSGGSVRDEIETPLVLPDISPTDEDLSGSSIRINPDTTGSNDDSDVKDSGNNDDDSETRDSLSADRDADEQNEEGGGRSGGNDNSDASNAGEGSREGSQNEGPLLIPFP
jgi:hypothetical protein